MLTIIVTFFRVALLYFLFFLLCMFLVATALSEWSANNQMFFAFGIPAALVWLMERRRKKHLRLEVGGETISDADDASGSLHAPSLSSRSRSGKNTSRADRKVEPVNPKKDVRAFRPKQDNASLIEAARIRRERLALERTQSKSYVPPQLQEQDEAAETAKPNGHSNRTHKWGGIKPWPDSAANVAKDIGKASSIHRWQGWVPKGQSAVISGRDIGGMIYIGTPPRLNDSGYRDKSRPYIDPSLSVATSRTDKEGREMPYWPGYSDIPPLCRATYLDWLSTGRCDTEYNPGYMFLYFYGLERRFIVDQPQDDEKREILAEVRRLADLYVENYSVQRYLGEFIQVAQIALGDPAIHEPIFNYRGWELPFGLKVAIGARIAAGEALSWDWTLSWLICHPEHSLRTAATRCAEEFRALFRIRFEERFPDGLKVAKPRKILRSRYEAASSEFHVDLSPKVNGSSIPDISGIRKPVEIADEVADDVTEALDKFSRYLGRNPDGRGSLEAQALLPVELRDLFPSEELERLKDWAYSTMAGGGLIPAVDVIARLEGTRPEKLTKAQLTGAADTLARIGFGLAPDPRFALRSPKIDEPLMIFDLEAPIEKLEDVSSSYRAALLELALSVFVVQADGTVSEAEHQNLSGRIDETDGISEPERTRLKANMEWLLAVPPDLPLLRRKLKDTGPEAQFAFREALVAAAHADGIIQSKEIAGIEKLYKALGLNPDLVYSDIHAGDVVDTPVRVKAAQVGVPGEMIPTEEPTSAYKLDAARIATIRSDTERVSSVLGEIFALDQEEGGSGQAADSAILTGLDAATTALVRELINETHLTEEGFDALCKRHGLMVAGALEAINEWAFETYDEALLDEYDGYDVTPEIAAAVKSEFEKEGQDVQA